MPANDRDFSREIPQTFTAVQWCAIRTLLTLGMGTFRQGHWPQALQAQAEEVSALMPGLDRLVVVAREIESTGSGLNHPDRKDW